MQSRWILFSAILLAGSFATGLFAQTGDSLLVFYRPFPCGEEADDPCLAFEETVLEHPEIVHRLRSVRFETSSDFPLDWPFGNTKPGFAVFRPDSFLVARWSGLPDSFDFGRRLLQIEREAPRLFIAAEQAASEWHIEAEILTAFESGQLLDPQRGLEILNLLSSTALRPEQAQLAQVHRELLLERAAHGSASLDSLETLKSYGAKARVREEAQLAIGLIHQLRNDLDQAREAYAELLRVARPGSFAHQLLEELVIVERERPRMIRLVGPAGEVVTGDVHLQAITGSATVSSVEFLVDERITTTSSTPPYEATVTVEKIPTPHTFTARALGAHGEILAEDSLAVNSGDENFWVRMVEPQSSSVSGPVDVRATVQIPQGRRLEGITARLGNGPRIELTPPTLSARVDVPDGEIVVLTVTARLDDGRRAEDAIVLNAAVQESSSVRVVEVPLVSRERQVIQPPDVTILEDGTERLIETIRGGDDLDLTLGLAFDTSASTYWRMIDLQHAAIEFLHSLLGPDDRSYLVTFSDEAHLSSPPTTDVDRIVREIRAAVPSGRTALHDAILLALLQAQGLSGRRAVVVVTDGEDVSSRYDLSDVRAVARRIAAPIYVIWANRYVEDDLRRLKAGSAMRPAVDQQRALANSLGALKKIVNDSGGRVIKLDSVDELPGVYEEIADEIRSQVIASFTTSVPESPEWRTLEVRSNRRGLKVRAPQGYFATPD